jgi:tetratricopeptide (TPR) repeat protein
MPSQPLSRQQYLENYLQCAIELQPEHRQLQLLTVDDPVRNRYHQFWVEKLEKCIAIAQECLENPAKPLSDLPKLPGFEEGTKPPPPVFTVPQPRPSPFVGREEVVKTINAQLFGGCSAALSALDGKPGVGKTTLALYLAWDEEVLSHFWGGVLWAALGPNANLEYHLGRWLEALGGAPKEATTAEALAAKIQDALQGRPCLMIIDDVWQWEHAQLFQSITSPGCAHLLTTRLESIAYDFAPDTQTKIDELPEAEAVQLLAQLCPLVAQNDKNKAALGQIARAVGGLPLALTLVGGQLRFRVKFVFQADKAFEALNAVETWLGLQDKQRHLKLQEVVELSLKALPEDEHRRAFTALAPFAPKPASFALEAAYAVAEMDDLALNTLLDFNLLEKAADGEERLTLHQVMAATAEKQAQEQGLIADLRQRYAQFYLDLVNADRENWQHIEPEWLQISHAWEWLSGIQGDESLTLEYIRALQQYQNLRGLWQIGIKWCERGLELTQAAGNQQDESTMLHNLAWYYDALGEKGQALDYFQQALPLSRAVGDRSGEATTLNNIGGVYDDLGEKGQALDYFQQALPLSRAVGDRFGESVTCFNIGMIYRDLGQLEEAIRYVECCVELDEAIHHPDLESDRAMLNRLRATLSGSSAQDQAQSIMPQEQIEALLSNTFAVKTSSPENLDNWRGRLEAFRQQATAQGPDWAIELAFAEALLGLLDDQPATLPEDNPYWPYLEALLQALKDNSDKPTKPEA